VGANNFYPNEHKTVYIKLKQGQAYLFDGSVQNWVLKGEIKQGNEVKYANNLNYNATNRKISFAYDNITTSSNYELKLMAYAAGSTNTSGNSTGNLNQNSVTGNTLNPQDTAFTNEQTITNNTAQAQNNENANKTFLEYSFVTSKHLTFLDKMNSIQTKQDFFVPYTSDTHKLQSSTNVYEIFNEAELYGNQYTGGVPLIKVEAVLEDDYFKSTINPLIYANYPLENGRFSIKNRDVNVFGMPPVRDVSIIEYYRTEMVNNPSSIFINQRFPFEYSLTKTYKQDFLNIRDQVVNSYLSIPVNWEKYNQYKYIIDATFPMISIGEYKIKIKYELNEKELNSELERKYNRRY
jgi:hypothetical protein